MVKNEISALFGIAHGIGDINFDSDLVWDENEILKHFPSQCMACNPNYIQRYLIFPMYVWERIER